MVLLSAIPADENYSITSNDGGIDAWIYGGVLWLPFQAQAMQL
jgi:hypothetical protein